LKKTTLALDGWIAGIKGFAFIQFGARGEHKNATSNDRKILRKEVKAMPTYEYRCRECGHHFVEMLTISDHEKHKPRCPKCQSAKVEQLLSRFFAKTSRKA
jgi:putative FmdB family regulatory protein